MRWNLVLAPSRGHDILQYLYPVYSDSDLLARMGNNTHGMGPNLNTNARLDGRSVGSHGDSMGPMDKCGVFSRHLRFIWLDP